MGKNTQKPFGAINEATDGPAPEIRSIGEGKMSKDFILGDELDYPQDEYGQWIADDRTEEEWANAEAKAKREGLRLHDTGDNLQVVWAAWDHGNSMSIPFWATDPDFRA
jgi:hypothetical protein